MKLIVNADDYGVSLGVNQAIIKCSQDGILSSTTVMVTAPYCSDYISDLYKYTNLDIGLHLVIVSSFPMKSCMPGNSVRTLVKNDGCFYSVKEINWTENKILQSDLEKEIFSQIYKFIDWTGRIPSHLDCHQHSLYLSPVYFEVLIKASKMFSLPIRYPLLYENNFVLREPGFSPPNIGNRNLFLSGLKETHRIFENSKVKTSDSFLFDLFLENNKTKAILRILENLPSGTTELMCHPGYANDPTLFSSYVAMREEELNALCDLEIKEKLLENSIQLTSWISLKENV